MFSDIDKQIRRSYGRWAISMLLVVHAIIFANSNVIFLEYILWRCDKYSPCLKS